MYTLVLPFLPPSANHTQKHRIQFVKGKPTIIRYNTPEYNEFKIKVEKYILNLPPDPKKRLSDLLKNPHSISIVVFSKKVCKKSTKYKEMNLKFSDSDNIQKALNDSIYPHLGADDARAVSSQGRKVWADIEVDHTVIQFIEDSPFVAPAWAVDALKEYMEGN
jgi:Holliday junction resolvase RusA-like endonuclease